MAESESPRLRVLIANENPDRVDLLADVAARLGHEVIVGQVDPVGRAEVAATTAPARPDVALVAVGVSAQRALDLIATIVSQSAYPAVAVLAAEEPAYVREAARRGVFAYVADLTPEKLQSAIDIALHRFAEFRNLQGALGRRAAIEQAKGILMARHAISADTAFEMLRGHSQRDGRRLGDVAAALIDSHALLLTPKSEPTAD